VLEGCGFHQKKSTILEEQPDTFLKNSEKVKAVRTPLELVEWNEGTFLNKPSSYCCTFSAAGSFE
jgi:hypothetical protein